MATGSTVPAAILRDAVLRTAPQDEGFDFFTRAFAGDDTIEIGDDSRESRESLDADTKLPPGFGIFATGQP